MGEVKVHSVEGTHLEDEEGAGKSGGSIDHSTKRIRNIFLPIDHEDGSNPDIEVRAPYPGVFIYRFSEGFNYPNANHYLDQLTEHIFKVTRRTNPFSYGNPGDRPWCDPGPKRGEEEIVDTSLPTLKAIILDFSKFSLHDSRTPGPSLTKHR